MMNSAKNWFEKNTALRKINLTVKLIIKSALIVYITAVLPYLIFFFLLLAVVSLNHVHIFRVSHEMYLGQNLSDFQGDHRYEILEKEQETDRAILMWIGREDVLSYRYAIKLRDDGFYTFFNPVCFLLFDDNGDLTQVACGDG